MELLLNMAKRKKISSTITKDRRQELRRQRRINFWQSTWRLFFLSSMSLGLLWGLKLPYWYLQGQEQIEVDGNQLMLEEDVLSLITIDYPEYLWRLDTNSIISELEANPAIVQAQLSRQFLPVKVNISIRERQPVAMVLSSQLNQQTALPSKILLGFLDREGVFIPEHLYHYGSSGSTLAKPTLTVINFERQYQPYWSQLYRFIENEPVKVFEINWIEPTVILLRTELGIFYLGNYHTQLERQLAVITKMKSASEKIDPSTIDYIDLSYPEIPSVKLKTDD